AREVGRPRGPRLGVVDLEELVLVGVGAEVVFGLPALLAAHAVAADAERVRQQDDPPAVAAALLDDDVAEPAARRRDDLVAGQRLRGAVRLADRAVEGGLVAGAELLEGARLRPLLAASALA